MTAVPITDQVARPGIYRRRFLIETGAGWARADMEDDVHAWGATLRHDGERIVAVEGRSPRTPWNLCDGAVAVLQRLVGMRLEPDPRAVYRQTDGKLQCTHLFETAGLAVAHAVRGTKRRVYDIEIPVETVHGPRRGTLRRDGTVVLSWTVAQNVVQEPEPYAGRDLRQIMPWAEAVLADPDVLEAVGLLRRAMKISDGRVYDMDRIERADYFADQVMGGCFVFQPGVVERARRNRGTVRDFSGSPDGLLSDLMSGDDPAA